MSRAPVTRLLLVALAVVFGVEVFLGGSTRTAVLVTLGANVAELVLREGQWWRLLTSMFLHIGPLHLFLNGFALYQLGSLYELWTGSARFSLVYFVSGLAGSLASTVVHGLLLTGTPTVSAGASGAIFGLLGALIALLARRRSRLTPQARSLLSQLAFWAVLNIALGFSGMGLDNSAHLGGLAAGILLGLVVRPTGERRADELRTSAYG